MTGRLDGKVAFLTGAASGIGAACARRFAAEGARLVLTDIDEPAVKTLAASLPGAVGLHLDVTDEAEWDGLMAAAGPIDVLVNSAGTGRASNIEDTTLEEWKRVMSVNSGGTFLGCRAGVRAMKGRGGSIVNLSSVAGLIGDANSAAYCASKGAVRMLTKSVALHCARRRLNVRCNSVHPSFTDTPMVQMLIDRASDPAKARTKLERASPMGRMATPDEVVAVMLFLASDESSFVNGAELTVDGGLTAA